MSQMSRGKQDKTFKVGKKKSKQTETNKKFRYQSFSQRISNIKVKPIRLNARDKAHQNLSDDASHFRTALEIWRDRNMSENFTLFAQQVEPLCQSLPQILYHESQILDLLLDFLAKDDFYSLEPLLDLITQLTYDIGARFDPYLDRSVHVVCRIATQKTEIEAIEWSFTSLAAIFRHLQRLLAQDITRPFRLMAPLMGQQRQKAFIYRFAAESLSFLVRKAAGSNATPSVPFDSFVDTVVESLATVDPLQRQHFQNSIMFMFAEAMRGVQSDVRSGAPVILGALLNAVRRDNTSQNGTAESILDGVLISSIHNTSADGFFPIFTTLMDETELKLGDKDDGSLQLDARLLSIIVGVRKASRISNHPKSLESWKRILDRCAFYVRYVNDRPTTASLSVTTVLNAVAVVIQYCPSTQLSNLRILLQSLREPCWEDDYLRFCMLANDLGSERFDVLLREQFTSFITKHWTLKREQTLCILPRLSRHQAIWQSLMTDQACRSDVLEVISSLASPERTASNQSEHQFGIANEILLQQQQSRAALFEEEGRLNDILIGLLRQASASSQQSHTSLLADIAFTSVLQYLVSREQVDSTMLPEILKAADRYVSRTAYLEALSMLLDQGMLDSAPAAQSPLIEKLVNVLPCPSHDVRSLALRILLKLSTAPGSAPLNALQLALQIEDTPLTLDNQRSISMNLKRLGQSDVSNPSFSWLPRAVSGILFGLLHANLTIIWNDVCECLEALCASTAVQENTIALALDWARHRQYEAEEPSTALKPNAQDEALVNTASDFECSNLLTIQRAFSVAEDFLGNSEKRLESSLQRTIQAQNGSTAHQTAQALRVLQKVPWLAEKKSRQIVPIFLEWFADAGMNGSESHELSLDSDDDTLSNVPSPPPDKNSHASREEKKSMLKLFSQFNNPRVLFRSAEVHSALMSMLCIGDTDLQRLSLKALFTWKDPSIAPYEKNLLDILDDARFRDELAVFLNVDEDVSTIRADHTNGLMPFLLRLLYGRVISRGGLKNRGGPDVRRKAVLLSLSRFGHGALGHFVDLALAPLESLHLLLLTEPPRLDIEKLNLHSVPLRKQLGMLRMISQMLDSLANLAQPYGSKLMDAVLFCTIGASRKLLRASTASDTPASQELQASLLKAVRQEGMRCLINLFSRCPDYDWSGYITIIKEELIDPRVSNLPNETAQGVSSILRLLSIWASTSQAIAVLFTEDQQLVESLAQCIIEPSARDEVKIFVMQDIIEKAAAFLHLQPKDESETTKSVMAAREQLIATSAQTFLTRVSEVLGSRPSREVLEAAVSSLIHLAEYAQQPRSLEDLFKICNTLLDPQAKNTSPKTKSQLLSLLLEYLPKASINDSPGFYLSMSDKLSRLFNYFLDSKSRERLAGVFGLLATGLEELQRPSELCQQLNSYRASRLGQPDFDARMDAFEALGKLSQVGFSALQWTPVIHNLLFLLKDDGDFSSTRMNASQALSSFVKEAHTSVASGGVFDDLLEKEILPALIRGIREPSEAVRQEHLLVLEEFTKHPSSALHDLQCLSTDEGAPFFVSILHVQHQQRLQALKKLAKKSPELSSATVSRIVLPLLETMLSQTDESSQNIADEIIKSLEAVVLRLNWDRYRFLIQRMVFEKSRFETKKSIRIMGAVLNALSSASRSKHSGDSHASTLAASLPDSQGIFEAFSKKTLGKLRDFIHYQDEGTVDLRVVAASTTVSMIMTFPEEQVADLLPPVLMDVSNVLRSKAQEARDAARKTLADIAVEVGPEYFGFIIKQLKVSLERGTRLHVLSYTIHSLLVSISSHFEPGSINGCVTELTAVVLDDVFGQVADDKEADGFTSKMKEVKKKALGYDSLELLATLITPEAISKLLGPLCAELEKPRPKQDKVDELLRRLREGIRRNAHFADQKTLVLCYELLRDSVMPTEGMPSAGSQSRYKIAGFAFDMLRRVIDKHENLKTAENMGAFIQLAFTSLNDSQEDTQAAAMKFLTSVIKLSLPALDERAGDLIKQTNAILDAEVSTASPLAQAGLRVSAAVLRERPDAVMKKSNFTTDLASILTKIKPDLYEPAHSHERGRQVGAFNLLKAALGRGILINEVYEVMETVREVMVTSPENEIRTSARAVYSRFVLDYFPKGGKAFEQQLHFLRKNIQYENPDGRRSVLEVIDFVLNKSKSRPEVAQVLIGKFWNSLLDLLVTDTHEQSRQVAGLLLSKIFDAADDKNSQQIKKQLLNFFEEQMPDLVRRAGFKGWRCWFEARSPSAEDTDEVLNHVEATIEEFGMTTKRSKALLVEDALHCLKKLSTSIPGRVFAPKSSSIWSKVIELGESSSHAIVKDGSAQLVNTMLVDIARTGQNTPDETASRCSGGLEIGENDMAMIVDSAAGSFGVEFDETRVAQSSQTLRLIARLQKGTPSNIANLLVGLSRAVRQEDTTLRCKLAALKLMMTIAKESDVVAVNEALDHILLTLSNLTDNDSLAVPLGEEAIRDQVIDTAREFLSNLREQVGNNEFVSAMQTAQTSIKDRREERRAKRRIDAVNRPDVTARKKAKKAEANKSRRKERNEMHAGRRRGY